MKEISFIPIQNGQMSLVASQPLINDLLGQVGYWVIGKDVIFHKDITLDGIDSVSMSLVVFDLSRYDDYDPLPIPADMEAQIVEEIVRQFAPVQQGDKVSDNFSEPTKMSKQ